MNAGMDGNGKGTSVCSSNILALCSEGFFCVEGSYRIFVISIQYKVSFTQEKQNKTKQPTKPNQTKQEHQKQTDKNLHHACYLSNTKASMDMAIW